MLFWKYCKHVILTSFQASQVLQDIISYYDLGFLVRPLSSYNKRSFCSYTLVVKVLDQIIYKRDDTTAYWGFFSCSQTNSPFICASQYDFGEVRNIWGIDLHVKSLETIMLNSLSCNKYIVL